MSSVAIEFTGTEVKFLNNALSRLSLAKTRLSAFLRRA